MILWGTIVLLTLPLVPTNGAFAMSDRRTTRIKGLGSSEGRIKPTTDWMETQDDLRVDLNTKVRKPFQERGVRRDNSSSRQNRWVSRRLPEEEKKDSKVKGEKKEGEKKDDDKKKKKDDKKKKKDDKKDDKVTKEKKEEKKEAEKAEKVEKEDKANSLINRAPPVDKVAEKEHKATEKNKEDKTAEKEPKADDKVDKEAADGQTTIDNVTEAPAPQPTLSPQTSAPSRAPVRTPVPTRTPTASPVSSPDTPVPILTSAPLEISPAPVMTLAPIASTNPPVATTAPVTTPAPIMTPVPVATIRPSPTPTQNPTKITSSPTNPITTQPTQNPVFFAFRPSASIIVPSSVPSLAPTSMPVSLPPTAVPISMLQPSAATPEPSQTASGSPSLNVFPLTAQPSLSNALNETISFPTTVSLSESPAVNTLPAAETSSPTALADIGSGANETPKLTLTLSTAILPNSEMMMMDKSLDLPEFNFVSESVGNVVDRMLHVDFGHVVQGANSTDDDDDNNNMNNRRRKLVILERTWVTTIKTMMVPMDTETREKVTVIWFRNIVRYEFSEPTEAMDQVFYDGSGEATGRSIGASGQRGKNAVFFREQDTLMNRIGDGTLMDWLREEDQQFVAVAEPGLETEAEISLPVRSRPPMPVNRLSRPLNAGGWSFLQTVGAVFFVLTALVTVTMCVTGYRRRKIEIAIEWSPSIHHGGGVDELLMRSSYIEPTSTLTRTNLNAQPMIVSISQQPHSRRSRRHGSIRYPDRSPPISRPQPKQVFSGQLA